MQGLNSRFLALLAIVGAAITSYSKLAVAQAYDGVVTGNVTQIDTVANQPNNYEFRVYLGGAVMCSNANPSVNSWAYLNASDANYKVTVANLMLAYSTGRRVTIYTRDDSGVGCHIYYVMVSG